jgi:carboxypeptidase C (cathepsin A)
MIAFHRALSLVAVRVICVALRSSAAICANPYMQVLVLNGYYDMATPYFATEYTFAHLDLEPELRDNIEMT